MSKDPQSIRFLAPGLLLLAPVACLFACLVVGSHGALARYPGSDPLPSTGVGLASLAKGHLTRQSAYLAGTDLHQVRQWYVTRLNLSPATLTDVSGANGCSFLTQSKLVARLTYTISVALCPVQRGTRVDVSQTWRLEF